MNSVIIKFVDDTTMVGLVSHNDETVLREEVRHTLEWYYHNKLDFNTTKKGHDSGLQEIEAHLPIPYMGKK